MAAKRVGVFDPSGRLLDDVAGAATAIGAEVERLDGPNAPTSHYAVVLVPPAVAGDLGPPPAGSAPRWIVGDGAHAARVAGAAASASATGVLLTPISSDSLLAILSPEPVSPELDLARARGLIATSLVDLTGAAADTLKAVAEGFAAADCIVWWKDGAQMTPTSARTAPADGYRQQIAAAARIAAASSGSVIVGGAQPRSVIADALRSGPTEVAGLVAIVADTGRRFSAAERTDLKAIATRLTRELSWLTSHRRIVAEGERLLATSLHDPLSGAMTRGAFEQTVTHEVAAAARRNETLTLALFDVVGLRRINLSHGHRAGDDVLATIAGRARATIRGNDVMGRPGGDELAVLLVGADVEQALLVARKILSKIQGEPIRLEDGSVLPVQMRGVITEVAPGERSGEAAIARCYGALRGAAIGDLRIVEATDRSASDADVHNDSALSAGTTVGGTYRVVHELSRGAMGVVYRGEDLGLGRPVAIKVLRSDLASDRDLVERFRAEAGILASLHHKNLVQVYALGVHAGEVYFVMELVEGQPLSEVLRATLERREWFPTEALAQIALEIGDALDAMHALGLIHRDVKPANILLDRERDRAVLVDVGVAVKAGNQSDAAGTPGFAAPESFLEQEGGPQTDVYGLAATMYCALTGRPPFGSGPAPQVVQRQLHDALTPPSQLRAGISAAVDVVFAKALSPSPKKRWASASTFATALGRALERMSGEMRAPISHESDLASLQAQSILALRGMEEVSEIASLHTLIPEVTGRVRAAHVRVLSRIIQHHLGESGIARIKSERPELTHVLSPTIPPLDWIELRELVAAFDVARDTIPDASSTIPQKVGRGTMSATFARLFGADPASLSPETVLAALPTFWDRYHPWTDVTVAVKTSAAEVTLTGYPGSTDICSLVASELERIVELTGAEQVACTHPLCRVAGAATCEFTLTWVRA